MRPFRERWRAGRKWRSVADELGRIGRCLNNLVGMGIDITPNSRGGLNFEARPATAPAKGDSGSFAFQIRVVRRPDYNNDDPPQPVGDPYLQVRIRPGWASIEGGQSNLYRDTAQDGQDVVFPATMAGDEIKPEGIWLEYTYPDPGSEVGGGWADEIQHTEASEAEIAAGELFPDNTPETRVVPLGIVCEGAPRRRVQFHEGAVSIYAMKNVVALETDLEPPA